MTAVESKSKREEPYHPGSFEMLRFFIWPEIVNRFRPNRASLALPIGIHLVDLIASAEPAIYQHYDIEQIHSKEDQLQALIDEIRQVEGSIGSRSISPEEARDHIRRSGNVIILEEGLDPALLDNIFLISGRLNLATVMSQLSSQYQETRFNRNEVNRAIQDFSNGYRGVFDTNSQNIYIYLDNIISESKEWREFSNMDDGLVCQYRSPIVALRNIVWHEIEHFLSISKTYQEIEGSLSSYALRTLIENENVLEEERVNFEQNGFIISMDIWQPWRVFGNRNIFLGQFNEFVTDYLRYRRSVRYGLLTIDSRYLQPIDIRNFDRVLELANITEADLKYFHRVGGPAEFFWVLRQAMAGDIRGEEQMEFLYKNTIGSNLAPPDWSKWTDFFKGIDVNQYKYTPVQDGCLIELG